MKASFRSLWQKIRKHWIVSIIVAILILVALTVYAGYWFDWAWTGLNPSIGPSVQQYQPGKTLWDWFQLIGVLAIPAVVGFGAAWYTAQQGKANDRENTDNQHQTSLQQYIDKMSELLLEKHLRESHPEDEVRTIARVRTITVLFQLDARRIGYVFAFLREAGLMSAKSNSSIVNLNLANLTSINLSQAQLNEANLSGAILIGANPSKAQLNEANLSEAKLYYANLSGAYLDKANLSKAGLVGANLSKAYLVEANLSKAHLSETILHKAELSGANLSGAGLHKAELSGVYLYKANLSGAKLNEADLSGADLIEADLSGADLSGTNLSKANLSKANLSGADLNYAYLTGANLKDATGITTEELEKQAKSLKGATMPDGSIHP